jgi:putative glutamine amidotransferase
MKPLVAVTATVRTTDGVQRVRLNDAYVRALENADIVPVIVPPLAGDIDRVLDAVDGLVLTGGEDLDPAHYGDDPHPATGPVSARRDGTELSLARAARDRNLPTLAICRGIQVVNVALGGTLLQDIPTQRTSAANHDPDTERHDRVHPVRITPDSRLARAIGVSQIVVNSFHHQAVDRLGDSLCIVGVAPDGVIEAVEAVDPSWWMIGVQWHPEELFASAEPWDRQLFAAFAGACGAAPVRA